VTRTVVLTFDNLGEAAEEERGTWTGAPGAHPSVHVALPALLDLLGELALQATFFVEGVNAERYPDAVRAIAARGHEVGLHAWRHDRWGGLDGARQAELLARGVAAFGALGVGVEGFRPPGGELPAGGLERLAAAGLRWCSPAGGRVTSDPSGIAVLGFRWPLVDATYLYAPLAEQRRALGLGDATLGAGDAVQRLEAGLADDDPAVLVLHPFLAVDPAVREAHAGLLRRLAAARDAGALRIVAGRVLAAELRAA
jgi:peptidoglycan/xylan/chitin deacetylase (PgdA/CDA1 family)